MRSYRFWPTGAVETDQQLPRAPSRYSYDAELRVTEVVMPRGNSTEYIYGDPAPHVRSRGNVTEVRRRANGVGSAVVPVSLNASPSTLSQTTTYDPRYNTPSGGADFNAEAVGLQLDTSGRHVERQVLNGATLVAERNNHGLVQRSGELGRRETQVAFDSLLFPSSVTEGGVASELDYTLCPEGARGLPCEVRNPASSDGVTQFRFNEADQLVRSNFEGFESRALRSADGHVTTTRTSVDGAQTLDQVRAPDFVGDSPSEATPGLETRGGSGVSVGIGFDARKRPTDRTVAGSGESVHVTYNLQGEVATETSQGTTTSYSYDANGNVESITRGGAVISTRRYDGFDRLVAETDAANTTRYYQYDGNGRVTGVEVRDGADGDRLLSRWSATALDQLGRPTAWTEEDVGGVRSFTRTYSGTRTETAMSTGATWVELQDLGGKPQGSELLESGVLVEQSTPTYDADGRVTQVSSAVSGRAPVGASFEYNARHEVVRTEDLGGQGLMSFDRRLDGAVLASHRSPDDLNLVTQTPRSLAGEALGRIAGGAGGVQHQTDVALDEMRRPVVQGPQARVGRTSSFSNGLLASMVEQGNSGTTVFSNHDRYGQPRSVTLPGGGTMSIQYTARGELSQRLVGFGGYSVQQDFTYDGLGRLRSAEELGVVEVSQTYRVGSVQTALSDGHQWRRTLANGALTSLTYPSGAVVTYERSPSQRLLGMRLGPADSLVSSVEYGVGGVKDRMVIGPGISREDQHDGRGRLLRRSYHAGGSLVAELRYEYDSADREVVRQSLHRGGRSDLFTYDGASRLTGVDLSAKPSVGGASPWSLVSGRSGFSAGVYSRAYDYDTGSSGLDVVEGAATSQVAGEPGIPPTAAVRNNPDGMSFQQDVDGIVRTRDALGNITTLNMEGGAGTLQYDGLRRLRRVTRPDGVSIEYQWRADGPLYRRCAGAGCILADRTYLYDGMLLLEERDNLRGGAVAARYYYAEESDIPFAADLYDEHGTRQLERYYFVTDRQGSVVMLLDEAGVPVEETAYDPFGGAMVQPADHAEPQVHRVTLDAGALVVAFTEPVLPPVVNSGGGVLGVAALAAAFVLTQGGAAVGAVITPSELEPGYARGTVYRVAPGAGFNPALSYRLEVPAGTLVDASSLENRRFTVDFVGAPGVHYVGALQGSTRPAVVPTSSYGNGLMFQSHLVDAEAGLYLARARVFDPRMGTFLQVDPNGYQDSPNLYAGFGNDPVNNRDPTGRWVDRGSFVQQCRAFGIRGEICGWLAQIPDRLVGTTDHLGRAADAAGDKASEPLYWAGCGLGLARTPLGPLGPDESPYEPGSWESVGYHECSWAAGMASLAVAPIEASTVPLGPVPMAATSGGVLVAATPISVPAVGSVAPILGAGNLLSQGDGDEANRIGSGREEQVARMVGGKVSRAPIKNQFGSSDIDVVAPNGDLIGVGGPAKARQLSRLGSQLKVLKEEARVRNVTAKYYFESGTPPEAVELARRWLGAENVVVF